MDPLAMTRGEPVIYVQPHRNGYGWDLRVPAIFVAMREKRATIIVRDRLGQDHRIHVDPRNLLAPGPEDVLS